MKIIGIFRNPAERLYSRYLHLIREDRAPSSHFEDCLDTNSIWWEKNDLIQEGFYYKHMHRYFKLFPKKQIKILLYDDLKFRSKTFMQEIFSFLEVSPDFKPNLDIRYNPSGRIKNKFINKLFGQKSILKEWIKNLSPNLLKKLQANLKMQKLVISLRSKNLEKKPLSPSIKQRLTQEVYKEDILKFQDMIQRDLSHWLSC